MKLEKYIGIPFEELDCYHLVKYFYKNEFGIELKDFGIKYTDGSDVFFHKVYINYENYAKNWKKVDVPQLGDIVALRYNFNMPKMVTHFALAVNENDMIHTTNKVGSILEINGIHRYKKIIEGFYRYEPDNNV